jgi:hypothetical protein
LIGLRRRVQSTPNKTQCERQSRRGRWARTGRMSTLFQHYFNFPD